MIDQRISPQAGIILFHILPLPTRKKPSLPNQRWIRIIIAAMKRLIRYGWPVLWHTCQGKPVVVINDSKMIILEMNCFCIPSTLFTLAN
jgi:hypothetical protein